MYNITLVCTRHKELGKCDSNALYQIIKTINPEVIFEETAPSDYDECYIHKTSRCLETDAINKYLETHDIKNIPVGLDIPHEPLFQDHENMLERIKALADENGRNYRNQIGIYNQCVAIYGFKYLNSIDLENRNDEMENAIKKGLQKLNDDKLFQIDKLWKDTMEKRENAMLQNIYKYSECNSYDKAIFTVGAGHRKSLIQKIQVYERNEKIKLNWLEP